MWHAERERQKRRRVCVATRIVIYAWEQLHDGSAMPAMKLAEGLVVRGRSARQLAEAQILADTLL